MRLLFLYIKIINKYKSKPEAAAKSLGVLFLRVDVLAALRRRNLTSWCDFWSHFTPRTPQRSHTSPPAEVALQRPGVDWKWKRLRAGNPCWPTFSGREHDEEHREEVTVSHADLNYWRKVSFTEQVKHLDHFTFPQWRQKYITHSKSCQTFWTESFIGHCTDYNERRRALYLNKTF